GAVYAHEPTQKIYQVLYPQFLDDFAVFPLPVTYSLLAPAPSTQYPFFNRAISTSCLAMMSRSRSTSLSDLLVCSAAYGFPFFGSSASSPSSRYRFTQADTRLCPTPYFLSISVIEICSSKCRRMKRSFSSLLHFRCGVPFFPIFLPPFLHLTTKKVDTHTFVSVYFQFTGAAHGSHARAAFCVYLNSMVSSRWILFL